MSLKQSYFQIKNSKVLHETKNNETLIINLENGYYYSLESIGSYIWSLLLQQVSKEEIVNQISNRYQVNNNSVANDVQEIIAQICSENILIPSDTPLSDSVCKFEGLEPTLTKYEKPMLNKFTDMEALLLADPIHEFSS